MRVSEAMSRNVRLANPGQSIRDEGGPHSQSART